MSLLKRISIFAIMMVCVSFITTPYTFADPPVVEKVCELRVIGGMGPFIEYREFCTIIVCYYDKAEEQSICDEYSLN